MIETLRINMTLTKQAADRHKAALAKLPMHFPVIQEGDELRVNYQFNIRYLGGIAECLEAVNSILQDGSVIRSCTTEEIRQGRCLIQDILVRLDELKRTLG